MHCVGEIQSLLRLKEVVQMATITLITEDRNLKDGDWEVYTDKEETEKEREVVGADLMYSVQDRFQCGFF
jgi:hypothetical protein